VLARAWPRDLLWLVLLAAMAMTLVPQLHLDWAGLLGPGRDEAARQGKGYGEQLAEITRRMASIYLPMAMGFLLCLRCGAIDVSIWVVSSLGGIVAACCIRAGVPPWAAMSLGVLAGAAAGTISGLLTVIARVPNILAALLTAAAVAGNCLLAQLPLWAAAGLGALVGAAFVAVNRKLIAPLSIPSALVTFWMGTAILLVVHWTQPAREIRVPEQAFNNWHLPAVPVREAPSNGQAAPEAPAYEPESQPLSVTRTLLALGAYSLVMIFLMVADWFRPRSWGPGSRKRIGAALAVSGALAAAGGVISLLDAGKAEVSTRLVDDFTIPVAALLAGAAFLGGRGRTLLSAVFLPVAILLTDIWSRNVLLYQWQGYSLQIVLLGFMILLVQLAGADFTTGRSPAVARLGGGRGVMALSSCLLAIAGIVLVGVGAGMSLRGEQWFFRAGLLVWVAGAVFLLVSRARNRMTS
jgi:ribose/xylose/arabinose/galactoside ABC-type transport system permease subunit